MYRLQNQSIIQKDAYNRQRNKGMHSKVTKNQDRKKNHKLSIRSPISLIGLT